MDYSWLLTAAFLVFLMQAGFLCLESGKIRSKNSINVAAKNITDFIISTINLAKNLELAVVAEGVETPQQLQFLIEKGCTVFQGFYFYKPLSAQQIEQLLPLQQ